MGFNFYTLSESGTLNYVRDGKNVHVSQPIQNHSEEQPVAEREKNRKNYFVSCAGAASHLLDQKFWSKNFKKLRINL